MGVPEDRLWTLTYVHLLAIEFFVHTGLFLVNPMIAGFAISLGAAVAVAGMLGGLNALAALFMRSITGVLSDRMSKHCILLYSSLILTCSAIGMTFAGSEIHIAVCRILQGCAYAFKTVALTAVISQNVPHSRLAEAMGWYGAISVTSVALGPLVGAMIVEAAGYRASFIGAAILLFIATALVIIFNATHHEPVAEHHDEPEAQESAVKTSRSFKNVINDLFYLPVLPLSLAAAMATLTQGTTFNLILVVCDMRGIAGASLYFATFSIASFAIRPLAGWVADNWGVVAAVVPTMALGLAGTLLLAFADSFFLVMLSGVLLGAGVSSVFSAMQAESIRGVSSEALGKTANTFFVGGDISACVGPMLGGTVLQLFGDSAMFFVNAGFIVIGFIIFIAWVHNKNRAK